MTALERVTPLRAHLGSAPALRGEGLDIAEAAIEAQLLLSGDLGAAEVLDAVRRTTACSLSDQPNRKTGTDPYAVWLAPDQRLLVWQTGERHALARDLASALAGRFAAATDVIDGLAVLDLGGARLPDLLAMACALDLDPRRFAADQSARTLFAGIPVLLYRHGHAGCFRLHVESSLIGHLWTWLEQAATAIASSLRGE